MRAPLRERLGGSVARVAVLFVAAAGLPAQGGAATRPGAQEAAAVLASGPVALDRRLDLQFERDSDPRLLVVQGRRSGAADAGLMVDGERWGSASGFPAGGDRFAAALPIVGAPRGGAKVTFSIQPSGPGVTVDEVALAPAARVRFVIRDQGSKAAIPGLATVESVDGRAPLPQGAIGGFPREGASWISSDGHGDLYVPHGSVATFSARSTPFRGIARQRHSIQVRDNLLLTFLLPADQLPEGSKILEGPPRPGIAADVARASDRARGIGDRPRGFRVVPSIDLMKSGASVVEQCLQAPDAKFLATNESGARLFPPAGLVTVALPDGGLLHSNGPVILLVDLRREGEAVRAFVKVRLPEGVVADKLLVIAGPQRVEHALRGPTTVPLDAIVPKGAPIALVVMGPPAGEDLPLDRAGAFRILRAP